MREKTKKELSRQFRSEHNQLKSLSRVCFIFLRRLDGVMKDAKGNPLDAGKTIATLANMLEMENDMARYFNLGVDYRKDDKDKEWRKLKAKLMVGKEA